MLAKNHRFHGHNSLKFVYKNGETIRGELMTTKTSKNPHRKKSRAAVVVSKKIDKRAVVRNKIRRRTYAVIEDIMPKIPNVSDIVIIINSPSILFLSPIDLQKTIRDQFHQLNMI